MTPIFYLLVVEGDVEPMLDGPYRTADERDQEALAWRAKHGPDNGLYMLDVDADGIPHVEAYSGGFFS